MENISLTNYIEVIRVLPDLVLKEIGIILENAGNNNFIKMLNQRRKVYRAKADWLKYYLLNEVDTFSLLTFTDKVMYKPHAEETVAVFKLAQEVYLRHPEAQMTFESPGCWMYMCEVYLCKRSLEATGLLGEPLMSGKSEMYSKGVELARHREDVENIRFRKVLSSEPPHPRVLLEAWAVELSKEDITFKKYWFEYLRRMKQLSRTLRGKGYVNYYLGDDGKILEFGVGKGRKSRAKKKKGFCKAM